MKEPGSNATQGGEVERCPVDHKTRELWLQQARNSQAAAAQNNSSQAAPSTSKTTTIPEPIQPSTSSSSSSSSSSWSSWLRLPSFSLSSQPKEPAQPNPDANRTTLQLGEERVVSSIPRSSDPGPSACPVNHEQETGASKTGHWVYPSERQFFEAMRRKGFDAAAADMKTVVPIHNAVNERAWAEILKWEAPYVAPAREGGCGGPRLHSFSGLGTQAMSPRARINTLLGYTAPFDRHDWVVDRCGTRVEYVIDFYSGRSSGAGAGKLNFYLDVRPKLNTWEGIKMRALKATGLV
ncbi:hypothetical protein VTK26DRAFT_7084 [Humicola hyalothermophila]